jgi:large subunit ribosomal protein L18
MASGPRYSLPFRRRREGRTDYKLRRGLIISGRPRAVVRLSNDHVYVQISEAQPHGDVVRASASSKELSRLGWQGGTGNLPSAYLTALLAGKRAQANGVKDAILDIGLRSMSKGSKVSAALKGLADSGLTIPHSTEVLPDKARLSGGHIAGYAKILAQKSNEEYKRKFSHYIARGMKPEDLTGHFDQVAARIQQTASGEKK